MTNGTKHTPGPWRCRPTHPSSTSFYLDTPKGGILCKCSGIPNPEEWAANAALVAAAPTLLRVCKSLYQIVLNGMTDDYDYMAQELGKARRIIAYVETGGDVRPLMGKEE